MRLLRHVTASDIELKEYKFERELSMEAYLIDNKNVLALDNDAFSEVTIVEDELTLKRAKLKDVKQPEKRSDGRLDLLITYGDNNVDFIGVVELKLGEINEGHLTQLEGYLGASQQEQILELYPDLKNEGAVADQPKWLGILVGTSISKELEEKISAGLAINNDTMPVAALVINRYRGGDVIYVTTDCYFKDKKANSRDTTKYLFNNEVFSKGRLVREVVAQYVSDNPEVNYKDLRKVFPNELQGHKVNGVFLTKDDASNILESTGRSRHFQKPQDIIVLGDSTPIAVSSQWGIGNIEKFLEAAEKLGYKITTV